MTTTSITSLVNNDKLTLDGFQFTAQDASQPWSIDVLNANTVQFTVQPGDQWVTDPTTKSRAELASSTMVANGTAINVSYSMAINTPNGTNNAAFTTIGQFHEDAGSNGIAAPFSIGLTGDHMSVMIGYMGLNGQEQTTTLFTDPNAYVPNQNYAMNIAVTFSPNGNGHLVVTRNGVTIVNYTGPLGWSDQTSVYWKEGIYRAESNTALTVTYSNLTMSTGTPATTAALAATAAAAQTPITFNNYNDSGVLILSTTDNLDGSVTIKSFTNGVLVKTENDLVSGGKTFNDYGVTGQSYTSDLRVYNASGIMTQMVTYGSTGATLSNATFNADGSKNLLKSWNSDGSTTTYTYTTGSVLAKTETDYANGAKNIYDYGVTGKTYTSDQRIYNSAGTMTQMITMNTDGTVTTTDYSATGTSYLQDRIIKSAAGSMISATYYNANGSLISSETWNSNGSTTTSTYTSGVLTKVETDAANGSRTVNDYNVAGQVYSSDQRVYNTAGVLTQMITYNSAGATLSNAVFNADGSKNSTESWNSDGSTTTYSYSTGNILAKTEIDYKSGAKTIYDYGVTGQSYTSDQRIYNAAGVLTETITANTNGTATTTDYSATGTSYMTDKLVKSASGSMLSASYYNANGSLSSSETWNANGSTTTSTYTSGVLMKAETDAANGSRVVYDYNISGQTYVSDERVYNSANVLVQFESMNAAGKVLSNTVYNANGSLSASETWNSDGSTTTSTYSSTGTLIKTEIDATNGSRICYDYGVTGQTYTSDKRVYDAANVLTQFTENMADGSHIVADYTDVAGVSHIADYYVLNSSGQKTMLADYNLNGTFSFVETWNADGSTQENTYNSVGTLTKTEIDLTSGVKEYFDYGVTGQTYTSDERVYNSAGTLTQTTLFNANGTSQVNDFGITGQAYTSDSITYDAKHNMTSLTQYHADGSLNFSETVATTGIVTENFYNSTGHLTETAVIQTNGATQVQAFATGLTFTGAPNTSFASFGGDTFAFSGSFGTDTISNFHAGSGANHDVISLSASSVAGFSSLAMTQQGANVVIAVDAHDSIVVQNVTVHALTASNFLFH